MRSYLCQIEELKHKLNIAEQQINIEKSENDAINSENREKDEKIESLIEEIRLLKNKNDALIS